MLVTPPAPLQSLQVQANAVTGMGQPALLYLCPLTLGSVAVLAATRGDLQRIWAFTDTTTEAAKKEGAEEQQQQQQQQQQQDGK
jgi:minor histocompatibility antigen H13